MMEMLHNNYKKTKKHTHCGNKELVVGYMFCLSCVVQHQLRRISVCFFKVAFSFPPKFKDK